MENIWYPSTEDVIEKNKIALKTWPAKRKDIFLLLSRSKLDKIIVGVKSFNGNINRKAAYLFKHITRAHVFGAGNRRTAYLVTNEFLWRNKGYLVASKKQKITKLFKNVRYGGWGEKRISRWFGEKENI